MYAAIYTPSGTSAVPINRIVQVPDSATLTASLQAGEASIVLASAAYATSTHYMKYVSSAYAVTAKISLDTICTLTNTGGWVANGSDSITYGSALPNPTTIRVTCSNPSMPIIGGSITDGTMLLTTIVAGAYTIELMAFPYLTKIISVDAT
ncbi:hypothetical protein [Aquabacterium sp.]|uniref:hypothetical protein n=1 Tax=Aquabacterium sp. TaxID=1872578 RepID=UPI003D6D5219